MRGSIRKRYRGSWNLILELGRVRDPVTGGFKRRQKWVTFRGTKRAAESKLTELLRAAETGEFVERSRVTVGEWLTEWLEKAIKPPARRQTSYECYRRVIEKHLTPALGDIRLQALKAADVKRYYMDRPALSSGTLAQHHAILSGALKAAVLEGLVVRNVASLVVGKPRTRRDHDAVRENCWTADEARAFLKAAKKAGPQFAAFAALALDSGARKGELCGLRWSDVDLDAGTVTFVRQLLKPGRHPVFGPTKTDTGRTVDVGDETVALLRAHRKAQAELKMRNRQAYQDLGLVFAKEWGDLHGREDSLGLPLQSNNLGQREFAKVLAAAQVRRITVHGLRHLGDAVAEGWRSAAGGAAAPGPQANRDDPRHLRPRAPRDAAGRCPAARSPSAWLSRTRHPG
jgi:integrase